MNPVITYSLTNTPFVPGSPFAIRKNSYLTRCSVSRNSLKTHTFSSKNCVLPLGTSVRLFPSYNNETSRKSRLYILSTAKTDEKPITTTHTRPARKSKMPPVINEQLVPGTKFTGKVRSVQPFGAFVDFGAFTDGLVHVSQLSDGFVKDVGKFVSIGQEVTVKLVEANIKDGRISLTMRESDESPDSSSGVGISLTMRESDESPDISSGDGNKPRPSRRNMSIQRRDDGKSTKFVKGQDLKGTVKNLTWSHALISLPEGEEGFLPRCEEADDGFGIMKDAVGSSMKVGQKGDKRVGSSLWVGQKVDVRVLRINRESVTLTMKKEEDAGKLDFELSLGGVVVHVGVVHVATNPFVLAFGKKKDISAFLDQKEKEAKVPEAENIPEAVTPTVTDIPEVEDKTADEDEHSKVEALETIEEETDKSEENVSIENEIPEEAPSISPQTIDEEPQTSEQKTENEIVEQTPSVVEVVAQTLEEVTESSEALVSEESIRSFGLGGE